MQLPLQITFKGMESSAAIEAAVRKNAERLDRFHDRIMSCHVVIDSPHHHKRKGTLYDVRIAITVPGPDVASHSLRDLHHAHEDVYVAIRDAFNAAARRLQDAARRTSGRVKVRTPQPEGRVAQLFADHGFIATEAGEVYFHANSVLDDGFADLAVGDAVRFAVAEGEGEQGTQASTVVRTGRRRRRGTRPADQGTK